MVRRIVIGLVGLIAVAAFYNAPSAFGDDVDVGTDGGFINVGVTSANADGSNGGSVVQQSSNVDGHFVTAPVCVTGGDQVCGEVRLCPNGQPMTLTSFVTPDGLATTSSSNCPSSSDAEPTRIELTIGMIADALRRVSLPASTVNVQPPNGRTLVNFDTNFYTERDDFTRVVNLLGRQVKLRIHAHSFTWHFGDGEIVATETPGAPYPALDVTHTYRRPGSFQVGVDTTYTADFSVDNGAWRQVPGTVTANGTSDALSVIEARPELVGYES